MPIKCVLHDCPVKCTQQIDLLLFSFSTVQAHARTIHSEAHLFWPTVKGAAEDFQHRVSFRFRIIVSLSWLSYFITVQIVYWVLQRWIDGRSMMVVPHCPSVCCCFSCSRHNFFSPTRQQNTPVARHIHPRNCTVDYYIIVLLITRREYMCSIAFIVFVYLYIYAHNNNTNRSTGGKRETFICLICLVLLLLLFL